VRLFSVEIEHFRSIQDQRVPLEGLVVLFGPNSAGKTSVLEAVQDLISQRGNFRSDPGGEDDDTGALGAVFFELPEADIAGSTDARLYQELLRGELHGPDLFGNPQDPPWAWLDESLDERLKNANLDEARSMVSRALEQSGEAGGARAREILARALLDPSAVYFSENLSSISMNVYFASLPPDAANAARRIATAGEDDALSKLVADLLSDGWAHLTWLSDSGSGSREWVAAAFPPVTVLDGDLQSLPQQLESAIVAVHNRLWHIEPEVVERYPNGSTMLTIGADFSIGLHGEEDHYIIDSWLATQSEGGQAVSVGPFDRYYQSDWYRVRHSILAAAKIIEAEANTLAPGFVKSQGTIGIEVLPVSVWGAAKHRVRATFTEPGEETRDLQVVGAGTSRWAAAAIRLASRRLMTSRQVIRDETGSVISDEDERRRLVEEAYHSPLTQTAVQLAPSDSPTVYIADEPEAHLHPAALQSVRAWLSQLAETAATVLAATHSTALLDAPSSLLRRVLVLQTPEGTVLRQMTGALDSELAQVSDALGLTKGELLLLARLALFVEGPHDQIILAEWFGNELRAAGIHVFPVRGVDNLPGLLTSELATALGIRIATLTDDTSVARALSGNPRTRGERAITRLASEAAQTGVQIHSVGLDKPDILHYLDEEICREIAPAFPGWDTAMNEWMKAGERVPWKRWVKSTYGLPLTHDGIRNLARKCRDRDRVPDELTQKIRSLIRYALSTKADTSS
jgi:AAA domain, putative AbiEii toxin, Type IV TA system/AAA domain